MVLTDVTRKWGTAFNTMAHLADADGIPSLATCWELLPMSFLVDYVYGVGDLIRRLQGNLLYDFNVLDDAWSLKIKLDGREEHHRNGIGVMPEHSWKYKMSYYYRSPDAWGLPVSIGLPRSSVIPSTATLLALRFPKLTPRAVLRFKNDPLRYWRRVDSPLKDVLYNMYLTNQ